MQRISYRILERNKCQFRNKWNTNLEDPQSLDRDTVEVICFDFVQQLEDLFDDMTLFGDLNYLVVNDSSVDPNRIWEPYDKNLE